MAADRDGSTYPSVEINKIMAMMDYKNMQSWLTARANISPDKIALVIDEQVWTYAQLHQLAESYAAKLASVGIQAGDAVGVVLPNNLAFVSLVHALQSLGAVLVPLNTRLIPSELSWQIGHIPCQLVIMGSDVDTAKLTVQCPVYQLAEFEAIEADQTIVPQELDLDTTCAILFTSGTSGKPKAVQFTYSNFFYSAQASAYRLGTLPDDRWLCVLPLYHVGGLSIIFRACLYGIVVDLHPRFKLATVNQALVDNPASLISLVPTMLYRLLQEGTPDKWTDALRLILLGGAAPSQELIEDCVVHNLPIATTYGLTEASSQVATLIPPQSMQKVGSVGTPLLFTTVRVVDAQDNHQPAGEFGEIQVLGPTVMRGYLHNHQANAEAFSEDDYLRTGDIGYLDADGDLWVVQRRTDLIISGGENIYPAEVEAILHQHPHIEQATVVGIDHPDWGQVVSAMVVLASNTQLTAEDIQTYCRDFLAGYKIPRFIQFAPQLPETASGKIHRSAVRERLIHKS